MRWEAEDSNGALLLEPRFLSPVVDNTLLTAKRRGQVAGSTARSLAFGALFIKVLAISVA